MRSLLFLSARLSVGGGLILFATTTWLMPPRKAVAVQSALSFGVTQSQSFSSVGSLHAIVDALFGLGAIQQTARPRAKLERAAIVGVFATCFVPLKVLRTWFAFWPRRAGRRDS